MGFYNRLVKPLLFRVDPERAHGLTLGTLAAIQNLTVGRALLQSIRGRIPREPVRLFGLTFPNRLGVAAGYDKDARAVVGLGHLGFGHVEIGTLTPAAQEGNPRPRVFRLPADRALINRMGFPNDGVAGAVMRLRAMRQRPDGPLIGASLGKQKQTPLEEAARDYCRVMAVVYPYVDYLAVNISSPNTPGLRRLQEPHFLVTLLESLQVENRRLAKRYGVGRLRPLLVKVSPDITLAQFDAIIAAVKRTATDGLIVSNTTTARADLIDPNRKQTGGVSGRPVEEVSTELIAYAARTTGTSLPIIGVGGVFDAEDARRKLDAGASLVQLYTGLVYEGPRLPGRILRGLG